MANPKKSFLVVDLPNSTETTVEMLSVKYPGSLIFKAKDLIEAFNKLQNAPPSLLILQLDLPKVNGLSLLERMRKSDVLANVPVIVLTKNERDSEIVKKCLEKRITYVKEPYEINFLAGVVEGIISADRPISVPRFFKKGETVFAEGDAASCMYVVKSGLLEVFKFRGGVKTILGVVKEGELIGEIAYIDKLPRSATVTAVNDTELVELSLKDFGAYLDSQPHWLKPIFVTILSRLRAANETIQKNTAHD